MFFFLCLSLLLVLTVSLALVCLYFSLLPLFPLSLSRSVFPPLISSLAPTLCACNMLRSVPGAQLAAPGCWAATFTLLLLVTIEALKAGLHGPAGSIGPAWDPRTGAMPATSILSRGGGTETGRPNRAMADCSIIPPRAYLGYLLQSSSLP